ncbi:hypothetical protein [Streptomyces sp. NPDC007100]|uniref:hypothetical protein n=1 Tax=unclassified Streptomyces TaxID=2593676 RepID=UPI0033ED7922
MADAVTKRRFTPEAGCGRCARLDAARRRAVRDHDRSAETDARVLIKLHISADHGTDLAVGWS